MAISPINRDLLVALLSPKSNAPGRVLASLASGEAAGKLVGEKAQLQGTRKEILQAIEKVGSIVRLTGAAENKLTLDEKNRADPNTLQEWVDKGAVTGERETAVSKFNSTRRELLSALEGLPSFSSRAKLTDKSDLNERLKELASFASTSNANRIKQASEQAADGAYDFSAAGNVSGTDAGRSQARRTLSDLADAAQDTLKQLLQEAQRVDMKLAGIVSGLASSGNDRTDLRLKRDLERLESQLIKHQRRVSLIARVTGDVIEGLDNPAPSSAKAAETLQQFLVKAETDSYRVAAVQGFNDLQKDVVLGLKGISKVESKHLLDKGSLNALFDQLKRFADDKNPDFIRKAVEKPDEKATADNTTFDFSAYGNADGTDNKRSEARRILNGLRETADQAVRQITVELSSLAGRIAGMNAARFASGYGPQLGTAISDASQFDNARRQIGIGIRDLSQIESLLGAKASDIAADLPASPKGGTLQDYINLAADSRYRDRAISDFAHLRAQIQTRLSKLPSISGQILNDPDAVKAAGDKLLPYLDDEKGSLLLPLAAKGAKGAWDVSQAGNTFGTGGDGRSVARRVVNEMLAAVRHAKEIYSNELIQISAQAEAAQVGKTVAIQSLNKSQSPLMSLIGNSGSDSGKSLAEATRRQLESSYQSTNAILRTLGRNRGSYTLDRPRNDNDRPTDIASAIDHAAKSDHTAASVRDYNGKLSDLKRQVGAIRNSTATNLIDKASVSGAGKRLNDYLEGGPVRYGQTARPDKLREATAVTPDNIQTSNNVDLSAVGNAAGTNGGRSEARRVLANMREQTVSERNMFSLELINQDARLIGLNAAAGLKAKQYKENMQKLLSGETDSDTGLTTPGLEVPGSLARMKEFLSRPSRFSRRRF